MFKTNNFAKLLLTSLVVIMGLISIPQMSKADDGPQNYCIPNAEMMQQNQNWGYPPEFWCYPLYYMQYNYRYFTVPILQVQIIDVSTGEVKLNRESRTNINLGQYTGPWEGCYKYTGARAELEPGGKYRIRYWANYDYYQYMNNQYCYQSYYVNRLFIDFNLDGDFHDTDEWINSPARVTAGKTTKIGATYNWRFLTPPAQPCLMNWMQEYEITIPEDQKMGVGRMRIMTSYYYPYNDPPPVGNYSLGMPYNACWNGYAYDYSYGAGTLWYGYNYGEMEDYLIEYTVALKGQFPSNLPPDDILLADEVYNGTTRNGMFFERPYVKFGGKQDPGTMITYKIIGPLPSRDVIYEALYNGNPEINVGLPGMLDANFRYNISAARGSAAYNNTYAFKRKEGGEYQVIVGLKKPTQADYKYIIKNFNVSWEWDLAANTILLPFTNKAPRYVIYPKGLSIDLKATVQNVGLRPIAKFDAYYEIFNSKGVRITNGYREINWDTANFGDFLIYGKQKVDLTFGSIIINEADEYTAKLTVKLRSANDMDNYNDVFARADAAEQYTFMVADEYQVQAYSILTPAAESEIIAGRPFTPRAEVRNLGISDISDLPTSITVTDQQGKIVFTESRKVSDIASGRYNIKTVDYAKHIITTPGRYKITFKVNHPLDQVPSDNVYEHWFTVTGSLSGTYTIGTKYLGNSRNFKTIDDAMDMLFLRGISAPTTFEFTDSYYEVSSRTSSAPAWDLSSHILGLGYNTETGTYNTLSFVPSVDNAVTRGSVVIRLNSTNGMGVLMGQTLLSTNPNSVQTDNFASIFYTQYSNQAGYITFDGGLNSSFKFILNSSRPAFGSVFYMNGSASNITIKNIIMENASTTAKNNIVLPNVIFSVVDGISYSDDEVQTETGYRGYTAGITQRAKLLSLKNEAFTIALDTASNKGNKFINNDISGFGYGIISYGIGPLRDPILATYKPYYNTNTEISNNRLYNLGGAGIVFGNEYDIKVKNNVIYNIEGPSTAPFTAGIIGGGNSRLNVQGYNNSNVIVDANSISNVSGYNKVYGILIDQNANKYPDGNRFSIFPNRDDSITVINNAIYDINAKNSNTSRIGIHVLTERNKEISNEFTQFITPRYPEILLRGLNLSNNTVLLSDDGVLNSNNLSGIAIQQCYRPIMKNNAVGITDLGISGANNISSLVFYQGVYPTKTTGLVADYNAYWSGASNVAAYRHIYTNSANRIIELGTRNEYQKLSQWQMATNTELHSISNYNFTNDYYTIGTDPKVLKIVNNIKGSGLSKRGEIIKSYTKDIYGTIRGQAGSNYDIGAIEFNGSLYNRDAEVTLLSAPGTYRATTGTFSDAEYIMTRVPIEVKAIVRNSGNIYLSDKKFYVNIYRESYTGTWEKELGPIEAKVSIDATTNTEIGFGLADGVQSEFIPKTYSDLRNSYPTVPNQFIGMEPNVTPRYRIEVYSEPDEYNNNNMFQKELRFYIKRSPVDLLVSNQTNAYSTATNVDSLASHLNKAAIDKAMNIIGWKIDILNNRFDYDVFNRAGWEPRNVNYKLYRSLLWSDGNDKPLTRLEKENITDFISDGKMGDKRNLGIFSQEMVRENTNLSDPDEVFLKNVLRAENRFPGNPLGAGGNYDGKTITGQELGRNIVFDILATGVPGDLPPTPGLLNITTSNLGISKSAVRYNTVQNSEWPDQARIGGIATITPIYNIMYVAIDWRHFGNIETLLRSIGDFYERNEGKFFPVELTSFKAKEIGKRVEINWQTASENGSSKFEVERATVSTVGVSNYEKISEVKAAGTSSVTTNYGPIFDNNVNYGQEYYYRLKMIDKDGNFEYSNIEKVKIGVINNAWLEVVKPNPVIDRSTITYGLNEPMDVNISLFDINGKLVSTLHNGYQNQGVFNLTINATNLVNGQYTIVMKVGDTQITQIFTVNK